MEKSDRLKECMNEEVTLLLGGTQSPEASGAKLSGKLIKIDGEEVTLLSTYQDIETYSYTYLACIAGIVVKRKK